MEATVNGRKNKRWEALAVILIVAYFLGRLFYFAFTIEPGLPPDESTHLGLAELYSEAWLLPGDTPRSYPLGLISHTPFAYHLLMGKLLLLNVFGFETHHFLRLMNILLSGLGLGLAYRLSLDLMDDVLARLLFLLMLTNTLMYTFISAAVSYDNLVNPLAVYAILLLLRYFRSEEPVHLLAAAFWVGVGCLTKVTFLPLVPILGLIWIWERRRSLRRDWRAYAASLRSGLAAPVWTVLVLACMLANLSLYGVNRVRFGRSVPSCTQVLELEQCLENRIFARNWVVGQYKAGQMTLQEAVRETERIKNPGDRAHALRLLENERLYKARAPETLNRLDYMFLVWRQALKPTVFGIQAHQSMVRTPNDLVGHQWVLLAAIAFVVRGIGSRRGDRFWVYLLAVVLFYFLVLVGYVNYGIYKTSHAPLLGVQGRYVFPVLVPAFLLAAEYLLRPLRVRWKIAVVILVGAIFVWGDFPYFHKHVTDAWFETDHGSSVSDPHGS